MDEIRCTDTLIIEGGHKLGGRVRVSGFKHALVPILAACVMVDGQIILHNVPDIEDTRILNTILHLLGAQIFFERNHLIINSANLRWQTLPETLPGLIHGSLYLIPSLLARLGYVELSLPGGCRIGDAKNGGERPIHHVVSVLERFGARFEPLVGKIRASCGRFHAAHIDIRDYSDDGRTITGPLVSGATKAAFLAAATAEGVSTIEYPYRKADASQLLDFLRATGVQVQDEGHRVLIEGRPYLAEGEYSLISDLLEVMTFIACAVHLRQNLWLEGVTVEQVMYGLSSEFEYLSEMGIDFRRQQNAFEIQPPEQIKGLSIRVTNQTIYSDSHPFFALMLLSADRPSRITETIWRNRFDYARELVRLGAKIKIRSNTVYIVPKRPNQAGLRVQAADLRSAAVLLLAALGIDGMTILDGGSHLCRGYEDLVGNLRDVGAHIMPIQGCEDHWTQNTR